MSLSGKEATNLGRRNSYAASVFCLGIGLVILKTMLHSLLYFHDAPPWFLLGTGWGRCHHYTPVEEGTSTKNGGSTLGGSVSGAIPISILAQKGRRTS